ncbi:MAG: glycogen synthase 2 [Nitrospinaceae bacterium]|nr:MAG: glycogen synthase 2 [Nitrospinaceae bacterium]
MAQKLKILIAASEVYPYAKTGGLADIAGSLPKALKQLGHDVRVIMPKYQSVVKCPLGMHPVGLDVDVPIGGVQKKGFVFQGNLNGGIPIYFVGNDTYYARDGIYGTSHGDYPDNAERFAFFCRSVLEVCKSIRFQPDIIHCNDWQTGLVPAYLKTVYAKNRWFKNIRTLFSIHNLGYQGNFPSSELKTAGLPFSAYTPEGVEFYNHFSFLKAGLVYADLLNTVSPAYAKEIQTKAYGFKMDGVLRKRSKDLIGILNGVDTVEWNPALDPLIEQTYSPKSLKGKSVCKSRLADIFSLKINDKIPILSMVTRLSSQKGIELVIEAMDDILDEGAAFVMLGSGDARYEEYFLKMRKRFPGQVGTFIGFDETLAHKVLAGSDLLLMPSQYEPCGLTQMYSLQYGTVPVVRAVGGLQDSIKEFNGKTLKGTGFKFKKFEADFFARAVQKALSVFQKKRHWRRLMLNGMETNHSWDRAARKYNRAYLRALKR